MFCYAAAFAQRTNTFQLAVVTDEWIIYGVLPQMSDTK